VPEKTMQNKQRPPNWPTTLAEAKELQYQFSQQLINDDQISKVEFVAGVDVGFEKDPAVTRAAAVVLQFPSLQLVDYAIARRPTSMPYIPGYLSFRECPAILDALEQLHTLPDLILCDGQGLAHPRRFGIACHLGILTGIPSIGVAKSRLIGSHAEVPDKKGRHVPLLDNGVNIGAVLRTREKIKPLYISSGHKISLTTAIDYVMRCTTRYRLPETTRWADGLASKKSSFIKRLRELKQV
jgi:deoxyribonuclease V